VTARPPTVLSGFTGLGGLDLGLEAAGFESVGCIEIDPVARLSLKANRSDVWPVLEHDDVLVAASRLSFRSLGLGSQELTLLAGAPPCQPYSKAAMWAERGWAGLEDDRATPLFSFLDLVDRMLPAAVVLENVPGFAQGKNSALPSVEAALATINRRRGTQYHVEARTLDAVHYGVPQRRRRVIVTAFRDGARMQWPTPTAEHEPLRAWDALGVLETDEPAPAASGYWSELLASIPEGKNYQWHTRKGGGEPLFGYRTRYWSFLLKLAKNEPSWTVPAQPGPSVGPFHWENRPLRVAELLRLQSFPEDWLVEGNRREQVLQVGNATPPLLAEAIGRSILATLGLAAPTGHWRLGIPRVQAVPPAEPIRLVPRRYHSLIGTYADHPGAGQGPNPRSPRSPGDAALSLTD
jgi:DNA (cytosine-5)-methyltransferase 1